jgi:hypothetical protein
MKHRRLLYAFDCLNGNYVKLNSYVLMGITVGRVDLLISFTGK